MDSKPVWEKLPLTEDDAPCKAKLFDGDEYVVRLASGEVTWGRWTVHNGAYFARIDSAGQCIGEHEGDGISGVREVMVSGYSPENIAAVFGRSQSLTDRVIATVLTRIPAAIARAKQLTENRTEPAKRVAS